MSGLSSEHDDAAVFDQGVYIYDLEDLYSNEDDQPGSSVIDSALATSEAAGETKREPEEDDEGPGNGPSGDPPLVYRGEEKLPAGVPTRRDIVAKYCSDMTKLIQPLIARRQPIDFMPVDVEEQSEYVNGVPVYRLHLFGPLKDGSKAHVVVTDINVFFDVRVPDPAESALTQGGVRGGEGVALPPRFEAKRFEQFEQHLRKIFEDVRSTPTKIETIQRFPIRGFRAGKCPYKRIYFRNLRDRKEAISAARGHGHETASDDRSCYYRKAAREYGIPLAGWLVLSGYDHRPGPSSADPLCDHSLRLPIKGLRARVDPLAPKEVRAAESAKIDADPWLSRDKTLVGCWDVESYTTRKEKSLPLAINPQDNIFCISMTFHWKDDIEPVLQVCIVDKPTHPDDRWITIQCEKEENTYKAYALVYQRLAPDILAGFNDSEYDWPFMVERANQLDILGWMHDKMSAIPRRKVTSDSVYNWNYKQRVRIKISPEESFLSSYLKVSGCVPLDVRACFKKLFPKSEVSKGSSLKFYLKKCNLPGKADLPHIRMWQHYESDDPENMRIIAHYCVVDSARCQALLVKRNVVNDGREVALLAYVSFSDSHYYAGGMKVCAMLNAYAIRRDIACSSIAMTTVKKGKYPGAFVFQPKKGLQNVRPVTALDATSLYPSVIRAYNLSPEKIVLTKEEAKFWASQGKVLHPISFQFGGETIVGWSIRHEDKQEEKGLYPTVLEDLGDKRGDVKKILGPLTEQKELIELVTSRAKEEKTSLAEAVRDVQRTSAAECIEARETIEQQDPDAFEREQLEHKIKEASNRVEALTKLIYSLKLPDLRDLPEGPRRDKTVDGRLRGRYADVCFNHMKTDSKQKALKVFMNTFYGEAGNALSPFFLLQLAGGTTSGGQEITKKTAEFALSEGFTIVYGDTDSVYLIGPDQWYEKCDADYKAGLVDKEKYWTIMVNITMRGIADFRDRVNKYCAEWTKSKVIKFAYEEVLFPCAMCGKKKYFGIPHLNFPNFRPKDLFIRGIDVVKQGQTGLARDIGNRIMWEAMQIDNVKTLIEIVEAVVRDAVANGEQWNFDHFVQTDAWKPDKKNVAVQRFIARMKARHAAERAENKRRLDADQPAEPYLYELPEPGERFEYVIVKQAGEFDLRGYKCSPKKGDIMEFARVARQKSLPVDVADYMKRYIVGLCARFINYDDRFQKVLGEDEKAKHTEKALDEYAQARGKKYLEGIIRATVSGDTRTPAAMGQAYKKAYREAAQLVRGALIEKAGLAATVLHGEDLSYELFLEDDLGTEDSAECISDQNFDPVSRRVEKIINQARQKAKSAVEAAQDRNVELAERLGIAKDGSDKLSPKNAKKLFALVAAMQSRRDPRMYYLGALDRHEAALRASMAEIVPRVCDSALRYEVGLAAIVKDFREGKAEGTVAIELEGEDQNILDEFRMLWSKLVGLYTVREHHRAFNEHLQRLKNKRVGIKPALTRDQQKKDINQFASESSRAAAGAGVATAAVEDFIEWLPPV